jgi:hypothetical protein
LAVRQLKSYVSWVQTVQDVRQVSDVLHSLNPFESVIDNELKLRNVLKVFSSYKNDRTNHITAAIFSDEYVHRLTYIGEVRHA